jgi:hypothetical protein
MKCVEVLYPTACTWQAVGSSANHNTCHHRKLFSSFICALCLDSLTPHTSLLPQPLLPFLTFFFYRVSSLAPSNTYSLLLASSSTSRPHLTNSQPGSEDPHTRHTTRHFYYSTITPTTTKENHNPKAILDHGHAAPSPQTPRPICHRQRRYFRLKRGVCQCL